LQIVKDVSKKLADYIFRDPEEGGSMLLQNASSYLPIYTASYLEGRNYETTFAFHNTSSDLTLRLLMPYIYGAPILDVSRSHTTTQHSR